MTLTASSAEEYRNEYNSKGIPSLTLPPTKSDKSIIISCNETLGPIQFYLTESVEILLDLVGLLLYLIIHSPQPGTLHHSGILYC